MHAHSLAHQSSSHPWRWPGAIIALLCLHALCMGIVVFVATRDPSFALEPQAYKQAVGWDNARARKQASERLGWNVRVETSTSIDALGRRRVTCYLADAQRVAVRAAVVRLEAFHHARASDRLFVTLTPDPVGSYSAHLPMRRAGTWEYRISAQRDEDAFSAVITQNVGEDP